jgi:hypothetical protein
MDHDFWLTKMADKQKCYMQNIVKEYEVMIVLHRVMGYNI